MPIVPEKQDREAARKPARGRQDGTTSRFAAVLLAATLGFALGDALRPAPRQTLVRAAVFAIDAYRSTASPLLARMVRCRFRPSCSAYAREAISAHGSPRGFLLAAHRLLRCHPFSKGGADPVPGRS